MYSETSWEFFVCNSFQVYQHFVFTKLDAVHAHTHAHAYTDGDDETQDLSHGNTSCSVVLVPLVLMTEGLGVSYPVPWGSNV